jgi:hypothetical protein
VLTGALALTPPPGNRRRRGFAGGAGQRRADYVAVAVAVKVHVHDDVYDYVNAEAGAGQA